MIERLEAEGGYSEDFMSEFHTFRTELRDFFNASSLTDMLTALRPSLDESDMQVMRQGLTTSLGRAQSLDRVT
jgi:phosphoglucan, water dikinase